MSDPKNTSGYEPAHRTDDVTPAGETSGSDGTGPAKNTFEAPKLVPMWKLADKAAEEA